jgi:taurine transport system permease protein
MGRLILKLAPIVPILVLALAWQVVAQMEIVSPFLLPPLTDVFKEIWYHFTEGDLLVNLGWTAYRALAGFALAAVLGVLTGLWMSSSDVADWFFDPIVSVGFPIPKIALLPIFILWFGLDDMSKIVMVAFSCYFTIVASCVAGVRVVEQQFVWSAQMLGASRREQLTDVILPAALPQILTGFQMALPLALIVTLVSEMIMGGQGLGGQLLEAQRFAQSTGVFASIIEISAVGFIVLNVMAYARRRLLHWHSEEDAAAK